MILLAATRRSPTRVAELFQDLLFVLAEQRRVPAMKPFRSPREPHWKRAVAGTPGHRMVHLLEEAAVVRAAARSGWRWGCITLPTGTPTSHRRSTTSSAERARHHSPRSASIRSCSLDPPVGVGQAGVRRPFRLFRGHGGATTTARRWQRRSLPSSRPDRIRRGRQPGRGSAAPQRDRDYRHGRGVRRRRRLDDLLGGDIDRGIDHRCLDEPTLAGPLPVLEREHQTEQRVEPRVGVTDAVRLKREGGRDVRSTR